MSLNQDQGQHRWALLVGIDQYPNFTKLLGCVNDIRVMRETLTGQFGFPEQNLAVLLDERATRAGILEAMEALAARVGKDDVVVFHYSGHGSRMRDREGDEADGMDETIVPYDSSRKDENRDITDDEIYEWLLKLTAVTPYVTLIFDCCHSGTVVRDAFGEKSRWVPDDTRPIDQLPPSPVTGQTRSLLASTARDVGTSGWLPLGERYTLIAGCSSSESSYEVKAAEGADIRHGALTYFLTQELRRAEPGSTYLDLFEKVAPCVTALYPVQHPQLEGARDREIFGVRTFEPMRFVSVLARKADQVILGAGAACGLTASSQWAVHPPGTKAEKDARLLGKVKISKVGAITSLAAVVEESEANAIGVGARAVEINHCLGETRLSVEVLAPESRADVKSLFARIGESKLLRRAASRESAEARIYLLAPRPGARCGDPAPALGALREETWAVVGLDGNLLMLPRPCSDFQAVEKMVENLEGRARFRHTAALANGGSDLQGMVDLKILCRQPNGGWGEPEVDSDGQPVLYEGDQILLEITNRHDRPLHMYVLNLGSGGSVDQLYPVQGDQEGQSPAPDPELIPALRSGSTIRVGDRRGEELEVYFPEELASSWHLFGARSLEGQETFKLFATTRPADFRVLLQPGFRRGKSGNSLTDLLVALTADEEREVKRPSPEDDWVTVQRSYRLKPRPPVAYRTAVG